jgi:ectoine hydroxylase-related dioxygenase (phytanoyl-CoA dioxygenase family)
MSTQPETSSELSAEQKEQFDRDGYVVIPGVVSADELASLRSFLGDLFDAGVTHRGDVQVRGGVEGRGGGVRHDIFARYPELRFPIAHPAVLGALRSLLGPELVFLPEMAAHDSRYGHWHKDTTPMERAGVAFHWAPDFRFVECGISLKDNDEYGGGLDVVPGSHKEPDHTPPAPKLTILQRAKAKVGLAPLSEQEAPVEENALSIPSKAGDLIIFDFHMNHMATQPSACRVSEVPLDKRKLALFFACTNQNQHVRPYIDFIRGQYEHLKNGHEYPQELLDLASKGGVALPD